MLKCVGLLIMHFLETDCYTGNVLLHIFWLVSFMLLLFLLRISRIILCVSESALNYPVTVFGNLKMCILSMLDRQETQYPC